MTYIIMGIDECGSEIRVCEKDYLSEAGAYAMLNELRELYVEYRSMWVEELRDSTYWAFRNDLDDYGNDLNEYY